MKIACTPGFLTEQERMGHPVPMLPLGASLLAKAPGEPSWIIGDPTHPKGKPIQKEDGGRTVRMGAMFKFYAIRDDHPTDCDCGCGGGSFVTFLLPEEY